MQRIQVIDYGRFAAAVFVLIFHYFFNGILNGKISSLSLSPLIVPFAKYGYLGVEFFFLISGYVIFFSARGRTPAQFAVSRAVRLYPAFIVAVLITTIFAQFLGGELMAVSWRQFAANLTFFPGVFGERAVDGVYWTLVVEIKFYILVFLLLMAGMGPKLHRFFLAWPFAMAAALVLSYGNLPLLGGHFTFFAAGALFALIKKEPSVFHAGALVLAGFLSIEFASSQAEVMSGAKGIDYSPLVIGMIVLAMFAFFLLANSERGSRLKLPGSQLAGALTYPLYLVHAHIGYMLLSRFATDENKVAAYASAIAIVLMIAMLLHFLVEKSLSKFWKALFEVTLGNVVKCLTMKSLVRTD